MLTPEQPHLLLRPPAAQIPTSAGVYRFLDENGQVIYVGKAKNLRQRLANYFQPLEQLHPRTRKMMLAARDLKWVVVGSELSALSLEFAWIKEFSPRFNVMFRDDKSYPYLALSVGERFPRLYVTRERKRANTRYFGPYTQVWALRRTSELLRSAFLLRDCTAGVYRSAQLRRRACLQGDIGKCLAPCVGEVSEERYRALVEQVADFLDGKNDALLAAKREEMQLAAADLDFERAALLRDQVQALEAILENNVVVYDSALDADVYGLAVDELGAYAQIFYVRAGRIRAEKGFRVDYADPENSEQLYAFLLEQSYGRFIVPAAEEEGTVSSSCPSERVQGRARRDKISEPARSVDDVAHTALDAIPGEIILHAPVAGRETLERWLTSLRGATVRICVPQRGKKRQLAELAYTNAQRAQKEARLRSLSDLTKRTQALNELQSYLGLQRAPLRIEAFDVSHLQGSHQVASMVVFEDGAPRKSAYRSFKIRSNSEGCSNDVAALREVLERRFKRDSDPSESGAEELKRSGFAYPPDLLVVDGGLPQVNAAARVLAELGVEVPVVGLAKRLEEVWVPGEEFAVILPRDSQALYLLQHLRDESHRRAITQHRRQRGRSLTKDSGLEQISGVGPAKREALLAALGGIRGVREASVEELQSVKGISLELAQRVHAYFAAQRAVDEIKLAYQSS